MTAYEMCITNAANYLSKLTDEERQYADTLTAFDFSDVLSICFCKSKVEIVEDIVIKGKSN